MHGNELRGHFEGGKADGSAHGVGQSRLTTLQCVGRFLHILCDGQQLLARLRRYKSVWQTVEQARPQIRFELSESATDSRLCYLEVPRGRRKRAIPCHRQEYPHVVPIKRH